MNFIRKRNWRRFLRFTVVGSISFIIDFSILNLLSISTGVNKGLFAAIFSTISFLVANLNSYYLNKKWTFRKNDANSKYKTFLVVSLIGALVNVFIVYTLTTTVNQNYFSDLVWLNASKLVATIFVAVFNYFSYKKFVFNNS